jgi:hypothetical protein
MQTAVIKSLIELGVAYEVAPYQADAKFVRSEADKRADYIWSSDTDILADGGLRLIVDWNWATGRAVVATADVLFNSTQITVCSASCGSINCHTDILAHGGQRLIVDWNWATGRAIVAIAGALFNSTEITVCSASCGSINCLRCSS